jgi:hypothetical protein
MSNNERDALDLRDLQRIAEGLAVYATSDPKAIMERLKAHKEDAMCTVRNYSGDGNLFCTRDGYNAMIELAERHRESLPVPDDYSLDDLVQAIRERVVRVIVDEDDDVAATRLLSASTDDARKHHKERTYHFPCVVVSFEEPPQFRIGRVTFTSAKAFPRIFEQDLYLYAKRFSEEKQGDERVKNFQEYIADLGWLATVSIPPCAKRNSKDRAEAAIRAAINLLRLVFGVTHGRDMRVAHLAYTQPAKTEHAVTEDGKFELNWSRTFSGALVTQDWYLQMENWQDFWNLASQLIEATVSGKRSEISSRVEDALTWFGEAAFEDAPGKQILNFVAALERLTTTESFSIHKFCSRVAMLAYESDSDFQKTYWNAFTIHNARSQVIHGGYSPRSRSFHKTVRVAHDLTRNAIFRGLEVHCLLDGGQRLSNLDDLQNFFTRQHSKWAPVLKVLKDELNSKRKYP